MTEDVNVIWRRGDGEMPEKVKRIVNAAQGELLLRSLQLPDDRQFYEECCERKYYNPRS